MALYYAKFWKKGFFLKQPQKAIDGWLLGLSGCWDDGIWLCGPLL
jgi:hypothetical protein